MSECKDCKWWGGVIGAGPVDGPLTSWGNCDLMVTCDKGRTKHDDTRAFASADSRGPARVLTAENFGCNQFNAKE